MGPQGKRRSHHCAVERTATARAVGGDHSRTRAGSLGNGRQYCRKLVVVWRQRIGGGTPLLWIHRGCPADFGNCGDNPLGDHCAGHVTSWSVVELSPLWRGIGVHRLSPRIQEIRVRFPGLDGPLAIPEGGAIATPFLSSLAQNYSSIGGRAPALR